MILLGEGRKNNRFCNPPSPSFLCKLLWPRKNGSQFLKGVLYYLNVLFSKGPLERRGSEKYQLGDV